MFNPIQMKFFKGQCVVCISQSNEWDYVVPNFNEQLKIALRVHKVPQEEKIYIVDNPMDLYYKGNCYISIAGFDHNIFDESGFRELNVRESQKRAEKLSGRAMSIKKIIQF